MANYVGILRGLGDVWSVSIPDLPGCFGSGATAEYAIADAVSAARKWITHQTSRGMAVPRPRTEQEIIADPKAAFNAAAAECLVTIPTESGTGAHRASDIVRISVALTRDEAGLLPALSGTHRRAGL
jgi:predicted RNase H-like HicB family nuclease